VKPLQYIYEYARPHGRLALTTIGLHFVMAVLSMTMPQLVRQAIDHGLGEHNFRFLLFAAILTILVALVRNAVWYRVSSGYQRFASSVAYDLRDRIYEKVQRSSYSFLVKQRSGDMFSISASDTNAVEEFLNNGLNSLFNLVTLLIFIFVILATIDVGLMLIPLAVVPIVATIGILYSRPAS
jgi:ABC-type multidrug transport system fused ATPase/permease subunit